MTINDGGEIECEWCGDEVGTRRLRVTMEGVEQGPDPLDFCDISCLVHGTMDVIARIAKNATNTLHLKGTFN